MIYHVIYKKIWFPSAETKRAEKKWLPFWKRPPSWIFNTNLFEIWVECAEDLNGRFLREKTSLLLEFLILMLFYLFSGGHFQKLPPVVKKMKISEVRISTFHRKIPIYIWSKFDAFPFNLNSFPAKPLKFVEISYKNYLTPPLRWLILRLSKITFWAPFSARIMPRYQSNIWCLENGRTISIVILNEKNRQSLWENEAKINEKW